MVFLALTNFDGSTGPPNLRRLTSRNAELTDTSDLSNASLRVIANRFRADRRLGHQSGRERRVAVEVHDVIKLRVAKTPTPFIGEEPVHPTLHQRAAAPSFKLLPHR